MCEDSRKHIDITFVTSVSPFSLIFIPTLLEGIYTGSIYHDKMLMENGFPGELCSNGSVIAIKTHHRSTEANGHGPPFQRAVLVIRDPYGSILSEFNRRRCNHTCTAPGSVLDTGGKYRGLGDSGHNESWYI